MTFEVSEVFKGTAHATQKVTSAVSSASCGFDGQPGRWLIYAKGSGILATDLCSGNTQDIAAASLSKGSPPTPGKSAGGVLGMRAAAGFGALAGLAMAGAVILLRRRRA